MPSHPPEGSLAIRTAIYDALLANVSADLDRDAVEGVLDCGRSATVRACRNGRPLLDFEEYPYAEAL